MNKPKSYYISNYTKEELYDLVVKLEVKIDKAIEYIENKDVIINDNVIRIFDLFKIEKQGYTNKLLKILKGDSNG